MSQKLEPKRGYLRDLKAGTYSQVERINPHTGEYEWHQEFDETVTSVSRDFSAVPSANVNWDDIAATEWLLGRRLVRGQPTMLTGPGAVGKTAFVTTTALSLALGENLLDPSNTDPSFRLHLPGRQKVYMYNLEDDIVESKRRCKAVLNHYGKTGSDLDGYLWLGDGTVNRLICAAVDKAGTIIKQPAVDALIVFLREQSISLLIIDPLVKAHRCAENDNNQMDAVLMVLKEIAIRANCSVWCVHHSGKAGLGMDVHGSRGASSIVSAARVSETLSRVSQEERTRCGFSGNVVRLENTKANLSAYDENYSALRIFGVAVGNGTPMYPLGDFRQGMELLSTRTAKLDRMMFEGICAQIRKPPANGRTSHWLDDRKSENDITVPFQLAGVKSASARLLRVKEWLTEGLLIPEDAATGSQKRSVSSGVKLNEVLVAEHLAREYPA